MSSNTSIPTTRKRSSASGSTTRTNGERESPSTTSSKDDKWIFTLLEEMPKYEAIWNEKHTDHRNNSIRSGKDSRKRSRKSMAWKNQVCKVRLFVVSSGRLYFLGTCGFTLC